MRGEGFPPWLWADCKGDSLKSRRLGRMFSDTASLGVSFAHQALKTRQRFSYLVVLSQRSLSFLDLRLRKPPILPPFFAFPRGYHVLASPLRITRTVCCPDQCGGLVPSNPRTVKDFFRLLSTGCRHLWRFYSPCRPFTHMSLCRHFRCLDAFSTSHVLLATLAFALHKREESF